MDTARPLIIIAGPTASGKTDLAIELAKKYDGEIICADSRTVYKEMDIATAKPTSEQKTSVAHHGLDLVAPSQKFSAAEFKKYAQQKVKEIQGRSKIPFIVGGSGLYIDGVAYDYQFAPKADASLREALSSMSLPELRSKAASLGIKEGDVNFKNPRHLARTIERDGKVPSKGRLRGDTLYLGLKIDKEILQRRLENRVDNMIKLGLLYEVKILINKYGPEAPGLLAPGYKAFAAYINGECSLEEAKIKFVKFDKALAKRQMTWFRRNKDIVWIENKRQAEQTIKDFLAKFDTIAA